MKGLFYKVGIILLIQIITTLPACNYLQAQVCGDVDGNDYVTIPDVTAMVDHLLYGTPVPADSAMLEFDRRIGITVGDLASLLDCVLWSCSQFCYCGANLYYSYAPSTTDTIFFPRVSAVPEDTDSIALPIVAATPRNPCCFASYLPHLPLGRDWDSVFSVANPAFPEGDTSLLIDVLGWYGGGRRVIDTLVYVRERPGPGAIVPELLASFCGRDLVVTALDTVSTWHHDLFIPTIMTYDLSLCCTGDVGNVDCDPQDQTDISDLTVLIDYLFISYETLCCPAEANADGDVDGVIDLGDLTRIIDYLFISYKPLTTCLF